MFLVIIFTHSLSSGVVPPSFKRAAITPVLNQVTGQSRVTTDLLH